MVFWRYLVIMTLSGCQHLQTLKSERGIDSYKILYACFISCKTTNARRRKVNMNCQKLFHVKLKVVFSLSNKLFVRTKSQQVLFFLCVCILFIWPDRDKRICVICHWHTQLFFVWNTTPVRDELSFFIKIWQLHLLIPLNINKESKWHRFINLSFKCLF